MNNATKTTPSKPTKPRPGRRLLVLMILAALFGWMIRGCGADGRADTRADRGVESTEGITEWTCSMDPQVRLPKPGDCPICGMDLVPVRRSAGDDEPRVLELSEGAAALADVQTALVERRHVAHEVRMVGKVMPDETRLADLTTWVAGRLDRLFVDFTGVTVREGDHMVEIYSPELYSAQQELLSAVASVERMEARPDSVLLDSSRAMVDAARERLRLWGLTPEQIEAIVERGTVEEHVVLHAPAGGVVIHKNALEGQFVETGSHLFTIADLSRVWVMLDGYETDLAWLRYGQDVEFTTQAYPGQVFHGRVAFIDPVLDDTTRTVKVRLNVDNPDLMLKPDMFVSATVKAVLSPRDRVIDTTLAGKWMCPMHPEELADEAGKCGECGMNLVPVEELGFAAASAEAPPLVIPATAPLITGKRAVVYVRLPDRELPTFEGREVMLGPRGGDWYVVHSGLSEGELVVVNGAFKLDSELQIRAKPSMMNPEGGRPGGAMPGHDHGGGR
jgi:Cu(I)/Ag(I) efflux system membrane fusion protein